MLGVFRRYQVNVLADRSDAKGAPVVYEDQPSVLNLLGRIEHIAQFGTLITDFTLIKPGALHRAHGGYLILDARRVLMQPFAWEDLKRVLRSRELRIESPAEKLSLISTVSLEPEPLPVDCKVILIGDRQLYYLLSALDPDFDELFKVAVDFDDRTDWSPETVQLYAGFFGSVARQESLRALDRGAVARIIEQAARMADDVEKLSTGIQGLVDLVRQSDYWAGQNGRAVVTAADVDQAIAAHIRRGDLLREHSQDAIRRGTVLIDTRGEVVGQVNGLSVYELGGLRFGQPSRITARVRLGRGEVVDIEREVELGGPIHSKGVLILAGFLGARFATRRPLALSASLVFEQSYSGVEGDSASTAELYALLSALAQVPVRQALAVTGSVNQRGQVQAIGGANEKIEGFFDVCRAAGLTGDQGVIIPAANVQHLMLRREVVEAVRAGRFRVFAVDTVDQGIELLTGRPAGERDAAGEYPVGSINRLVEDRLSELAEAARRFAAPHKEDNKS
jgi:lon-related putative ATP-dependent protease